MDMYDSSCLGYAINIAPRLDNFPYAQWRIRFKLFVQSNQFDLWKIIEDAYVVPILKKSKWCDNDKRLFNMNKLLLEYLISAFHSSFSNKFANFD